MTERQKGLSVADAIKQRRSVQYFDPDFVIPAKNIRKMIEHAMLAPSAFNLQHWRFLDICEPRLREKVQAVAFGQPQVTQASTLLLVCMDISAWKSQAAVCWQHVDESVRNNMLQSIEAVYAKNPVLQRDEALRSCSLAAMNIMLIAQEMGYDSCAMDGFDFDKVARLVNLPPSYEICMMLAVGKQQKAPHPKGGVMALDKVFFKNSFK